MAEYVLPMKRMEIPLGWLNNKRFPFLESINIRVIVRLERNFTSLKSKFISLSGTFSKFEKSVSVSSLIIFTSMINIRYLSFHLTLLYILLLDGNKISIVISLPCLLKKRDSLSFFTRYSPLPLYRCEAGFGSF